MSFADAIDNAIAVVAPSWARSRKEARFVARQFDQVDFWRDRVRASSTAGGPKTEARTSRRSLLRDARAIDRNNPFIAGVLDTITNNVVGTGIRLEANVISTRGTKNQARNDRIESGFPFIDITYSLHDFGRRRGLQYITIGTCL